MAEYSAVPTTSWVSLVAGPKDLNICNRGSCTIVYATHTTTPTGIGMSLKSGQTLPVKVASGENLYIKANDPTSDARLIGIDVPSV